MSDYSLIQELKRDGTLKLYHDYRSRTLHDFSGNGHHGTATDFEFFEDHLQYSGGAARVDVPYNANLLIPNGGSIVVLPYRILAEQSTAGISTDVYIEAADLVSRQYLFRLNSPVGGGFLYAENGAVAMRTAASMLDEEGAPYHQCYGCTIAPGAGGAIYVNGVSRPVIPGNYTDPLYQTASTVRIGANQTLGTSAGCVQAVLVTSTQLTATQHAQIYGELMS